MLHPTARVMMFSLLVAIILLMPAVPARAGADQLFLPVVSTGSAVVFRILATHRYGTCTSNTPLTDCGGSALRSSSSTSGRDP
jgi:hypothetical protein